MINIPHIIVGAAIGAKTHNLGLIIILGLLSHFIMDKLPHWDYSWSSSIEKYRKEKSIKSLFPVVLKCSIDITIGLLIVLIVAWQKDFLNPNNLIFIILGIFFASLPDAIVLLAVFWGSNKILQQIFAIHEKYLHLKHKEKEGEITFLGLATQILVIIIALFVLVS